MSLNRISRRAALTKAGCLAGAVFTAGKLSSPAFAAEASSAAKPPRPFLFSLNMATIQGQKLGIEKEVQVAGAAGYDAIEPWISSLDDFVKAGGKPADLKKQISDAGLAVESAIGFAEWLAEDDARRAKGIEQARHDMDLVAQIGGKRMAAPPAGATDVTGMDLQKAADRYRALLEIGDPIGVVAELELWSFSKSLGHLSECVAVAVQCGHPRACILADIFHLYKSGSDYRGLAVVNGRAATVIHMNDFPADPSREKIDDSYRVYPGDGIYPLADTLRLLRETGGQRILSLEVFNRNYWKQDALTVAKTGLAKMKQVVAAADEVAN
ncbi:MAG: sugar phosphate isomerase/epimerase family protein [Verrucomicrobiota bacterium]|jgi:sugar phosphate isomerase/epimerase